MPEQIHQGRTITPKALKQAVKLRARNGRLETASLYVDFIQDGTRKTERLKLSLFTNPHGAEQRQHNKNVMQMDVLRCKSAEMVRKEVAVHLLAYNLIRTVMARAADLANVLPRRLSFKTALQTLNAFCHALSDCAQRKLPELHARTLASIARLLLPVRPNRVEPRAVKRRPKPHRLLTVPREVARARLAKKRQRIMAAFG